MDVVQLQPLQFLVEGARIVNMGELAHTREIFPFDEATVIHPLAECPAQDNAK